MVILTAENLTKTVLNRTLFENLTFGLNANQRIGLIGVNGSGKSTLLKLLAGVESADSGRVTLRNDVRLAYLDQNPVFEADITVLDYLFEADTPTMGLLRAYQALTARLEGETSDASLLLLSQLNDLSAKMDQLGAWEVELNARMILSRLGIEELDKKLGQLSGGLRKRVALARTLIDHADPAANSRASLLILDEPTNHIDIDTVAWLEEYLARLPGALLLVTHDRYFLDRVVNRIFELDNQRLYTYDGNYETFLAARAQRMHLEGELAWKRENLLRKEMAWLQRGARARSTKQKAHIDRIEGLVERMESDPGTRAPLTIALGSRRLGKRAIEIRNLSKSYDGQAVIKDFTYDIEPGDRIGIIGPNGVGKSTLLNILTGRVEADQGEVIIGQTVHISYYDQENRGLLDEQRVLEYIQEGAHLIRLADGSKARASAMLEWFLFPPEQQYNYIRTLSGGEKRRLYLLRTLMEQPNILLLDEPTNDLDIQTLTVLEDFVDQFKGIVIAVSHDRYFLDRVADFILSFEGDGKIREYPGNYSLYRQIRQREASEKEAKKESTSQKSKPAAAKITRARQLTWKEERELEKIEERIEELENGLRKLPQQMVKFATDYLALKDLQEEQQAAEAELEEIMERWLELSEIREASA